MFTEQFSSFQIGKLLHVSRQAINQWIDRGYMTSFRTPGGHRRVRRSDLIDFLMHRRIPLPPELEGGPTPAPERPTIMIVDDEEDYLLVLAEAIAQCLPNARVRCQRNGLDALLAIGVERPDLLILDLCMPKIDGFEVCRRLKLNAHTRGLPIMIVTGYKTDELREPMRNLDVECIYSKAQPIQEISRRVADFFQPSRAQAPAGDLATMRFSA
jgi:excisionase family DNA binding protein